MTNPIEGIADVDLDSLSDHELLASMRDDAQLENFFAARRLRKMDEFRQRREADYHARKADDPHFTLTPIQETTVEVSPLLGLAPAKVVADLRMMKSLRQDLPGIWELCETGQLDVGKAAMVWQSADLNLKHAEDIPKLGEAIRKYLTPAPADDNPKPLVTKTRKQLQSRLTYWLRKFDKKTADDLFKQGFKTRNVRLTDTQDGMGYLTVNHAGPDLLAADHRLTLIAKTLKQTPGDEDRTLEQLRADVMLDLILGKLTVGASIRELEDEETADGGDPAETVRRVPTAAYARPVINVTVPIQTLMGLTDDPGVMSGGSTIPAALARRLAQDPDSTWYRMLTDPARNCVELSTKAYRPTMPMWRQVVANHQTCFLPTCDTPATRCEADHKVPYPKGATSTGNLHPGCPRDHKAKHARGFHLTEQDGNTQLRTRAGFTHTVDPPDQPVAEWPDLSALDEEPTAEEFLNTLRQIRQERESMELYAFREWQEEKARADYRASYPDVPDEVIDYWLYDDDPRNDPPPVTRQGYTAMENELFAKQAYGEHAFA